MGDGWREEMCVCAQCQIASSLTRSAFFSLHSFLPSVDGEANIYILHILLLLPGLYITSCSILMSSWKIPSSVPVQLLAAFSDVLISLGPVVAVRLL